MKSTITNEIPTYAQYGINLVPSQDLAFQRGAGIFNESPNYDQTTNRGPTYSEALSLYGSGKYYNEDETIKSVDNYSYKDWAEPIEKPKYSIGIQQAPLDNDNNRKFVVGSTGIHPERTNSWNRPDFGMTRGTDQYQVWAINSMQITPNALLNFFFSEENVNYLQDKIISEVRRIKSVDISKQSVDELLIIMRNKYLYGISGYLPYKDPNKVYARGTIVNKESSGVNSNGTSRNLAYQANSGGCTDLEVQVTRLNQSVLEECVKSVLSGIGMYMTYYNDASSLPVPLSLPVLTSSKGDSVLTPNLGFESGHEMTAANTSFNQRFNIL
jgi:hypothetical protein